MAKRLAAKQVKEPPPLGEVWYVAETAHEKKRLRLDKRLSKINASPRACEVPVLTGQQVLKKYDNVLDYLNPVRWK